MYIEVVGFQQPGTLGISTHSEMQEAADPLAANLSPWPLHRKTSFLGTIELSNPDFPWTNRMMFVYNLCKLVYIYI